MFRNDASAARERLLTPEPRLGFWGWWLDLVAPPRKPETTANPHLREKLRKAELAGYFLFILTFFSFFDLLLALLNRRLLSIVEIFVFLGFLALVGRLNRDGHSELAAGLVIGAMMLSIAYVIIFALADKGASDLLPTYDFFIYPIMIGSIFMPRKLIIPFTLVEILFIWYNLLLGPHPREIIQVRGTPVMWLWLARPTLMLCITAIVSWLGSRSVEQAILRADHAEELIAAERLLSAQSRMLLQQQEQLKAEISQILIVHREAAAGNYSVRAPLNSQGMIWQIAHSLNNLLARCQELARDHDELKRAREDVEKVSYYIEQLRQGKHLPLPICHSILGKRLVYALTTHTPPPRPSQPLSPERHSSGPIPRPNLRPSRVSFEALRDNKETPPSGQKRPGTGPTQA
uniref:HAMP domain-containing protein n=1 Tax=Thermogemmatispora argillosa TaxID=2045280 RepID=A0A455SXH3_9CHLR|nr:hypothetical protein KTA_04170 [Thermogemmatispora argillosa]